MDKLSRSRRARNSDIDFLLKAFAITLAFHGCEKILEALTIGEDMPLLTKEGMAVHLYPMGQWKSLDPLEFTEMRENFIEIDTRGTIEFYIAGESYAGHYVPQIAHTILLHNKKANKTIINFKGILIGNAVIDDEMDTKGILTVIPKKPSVTNFDPCSDGYVYAYLNRVDVQEAMHANVTKLHHDWEPCSELIGRWEIALQPGDTDGRVPVTSTKYSINKMKLPLKLSGIRGTSMGRGDLTFATVRGAGHQVPSFQPKRALSLIKHFLDGTTLPDTARYE
ncbi:hypothetical protein F3Y22_tig00018953pilonHSYRG00001 [Hibiscus syriacus]|uniref:Carboxypeptidase n=1 Tax=Hibiscus syriacus TaxID=106335 RepID=A0A6A3BUQ1_HIBSY|nr:hypothetical protein F3Y22_tig00018953pilonHSYRG00001 [Hibiscus syriacus]